MMATRASIRAAILAVLAIVTIVTSADAQRIGSTFVFDGDTVAIGGTRARIWGIDAPDQPLGMKKADGNYLARTVEAEGGVTCAFEISDNQAMRRARAPACPSPLTNHDRIVTSCRFRRSGEDVGERMTRAGYAVDCRGFSAGYYRAAQLDARSRGAGLWSSWPRQMTQLADQKARQRSGCSPSRPFNSAH